MFHSPTTPRQLIATLRVLAMREPQSREELAILESECVALALHIRDKPSLGDLPEAVWHFLSDPDIRFKDPVYAKAQLASFSTALAKWERERAI